MIAVVGVPTEIADAVSDGVRVTIGIKSDELREWTARLQSDDAAECKMAEEGILGSSRSKVCYKTMANILVRVRAFKRAVVKILGCADECGECSVVEGVGEGVVRVQAEISSKPFNHLKRQAVINRISGV